MAKLLLDKKRLNILKALEKRLNYCFRDISLLSVSLTHRSYVNENQLLLASDNERFEFLGDAVLGLCVSDLLTKKYTDFSEGVLSKMRASLVNVKPLAILAQNLQIGSCLLLGHGEEKSGGRAKDSLLANSFEAIIAAIYLDSNFEKINAIVKILIEPFLKDDTLHYQYFDYKTALQEFCHKKYKTAPVYTLSSSHGPEHSRIFEVEVNIAGKTTQTGKGKNKKEAEKQAAKKAWEMLQDEN
ncbi:MAG: ribonuclease III [Deltaproteobacteria bacterium RBG_19FT_COMBO_43_11]|nr:MAG: ribonuclease III [Deltaproteobacteria bacterium RBG_19FT_COMBO_43_11]